MITLLLLASILSLTLGVAVWRVAKAGGKVKVWFGVDVSWGGKK